ncbi:MAG: M20 family metallopeptidase [Sulfolobales archaeon]
MDYPHLSRKESEVLNFLTDLKDYISNLTTELVKIPTVNPPGEHYEEFAEFLAKELEGIGFQVDLIRVPTDELEKHGVRQPRVVVVGTLRFAEVAKTLVLNGHYDVVPPGSGWSTDPFQPVVRNGNIYGRGVADMKGALASMIAAVKSIVQSGVSLKGNIIFIATPDEETGGHLGAGYLVKKRLVRGDACVIGEPTEPDKVDIAEKGALWVELITYGRSAHGSMPHLGVNAVEKMAKVIVSLESLKKAFAERRSKTPLPEHVRYDTINIGGVIQGGTKINVVPDKCSCTLDIRVIPEETIEAVEKALVDFLEGLRREDPELKLDMRVIDRIDPAYTSETEEIVEGIKSAISVVVGRSARLGALPGFTDMRWFKALMPTVLYGPGSISQAHVPDEHVALENLLTAAKVYALTSMRFLGYS